MNNDERQIAETLLGLNIWASQLSKHLREMCGKQVTHKDVHNIRQKSRDLGTDRNNFACRLQVCLQCRGGQLEHILNRS